MIITKHGRRVVNETISLKDTKVVDPAHIAEANALIDQIDANWMANVGRATAIAAARAFKVARVTIWDVIYPITVILVMFGLAAPAFGDVLKVVGGVVISVLLIALACVSLGFGAGIILQSIGISRNERLFRQLDKITKPTGLRGKFYVGAHSDKLVWHAVEPFTKTQAELTTSLTKARESRNAHDACEAAQKLEELRHDFSQILAKEDHAHVQRHDLNDRPTP
ncbi:hypothetical protein [Microbacterium gorillae]|uniref:hypothetical protein n=1 Tax=Microbacterium gorillae TaxID=1231063 RepID=UPI003D97B604